MWIKAMLELKGSSFAAIARELHVTRGAVRHVLDQPRPRMERVIAAKLGLAPEDIWPERYCTLTKRPRSREYRTLSTGRQ